jgi:hypothetical protein
LLTSNYLPDGGTGLFAELDKETKEEKRRLVVNFSLNAGEDDAHLINDIDWIKKVGGREHIISVIHLDKEEQNDDDAGGFLASLLELLNINRPQNKSPSRPTLVLEYMAAGDLDSLRKRFQAAGKPVPNRMAWAFYLCRELQTPSGAFCYP